MVMLVSIVLLAVLVGFIVYVYEERLGGVAYLLGQVAASIVAIGLIAWITYKATR
jgi:hypothetical protein